MTEQRDDIIWSASIKALRETISDRVNKCKQGADCLKNQDGLYAEEIRRLERLYQDMLSLIDATIETHPIVN